MARGRSLRISQEFPNDESCAAFLIERRWPDGFVCPGCGERRAALLKTRRDCTNVLIAVGKLLSRQHNHASLQVAAYFMVLGGASRDNPLQRHVGAPIGGPTQRHLQDHLVVDAEAAANDG